MNSGTSTDIQQIDSVDNGFNANDKDGTLSTSMDRIKGNLNLNHEAGIAPHLSITNWTSGIIRPLSSKPKATWTRINRMDFGLSGFTKALTLPTLGKRDSMNEATTCPCDEKGRLVVKRGKVDANGTINDDVLTGVEVHPCREQ